MKISCSSNRVPSGYIIGFVVKDDITYAIVADRFDGRIYELELGRVIVDKEELNK